MTLTEEKPHSKFQLERTTILIHVDRRRAKLLEQKIILNGYPSRICYKVELKDKSEQIWPSNDIAGMQSLEHEPGAQIL